MNYDNFTKEQIVSILKDTLEYLSKLREEIERLQKENKELEEIICIRECQLEDMQNKETDYTQVNILEMKLETLNSIIKEARELLEEIYKILPGTYNQLLIEIKKELEILDKVEENK